MAESATLAEYECVTEQKALDAAHETLFRGACARHRRIIDAVHKAAGAPIYNAASDIERKAIDARYDGTGSETLAEVECVAKQKALDAAYETLSTVARA